MIIFPDAGDPNIPPIKKGSVSISGAIHNVYLARQLLLGSLPIVMMFDLPESLDVSESLISRLQEDQDVGVNVKPKARQTNKSCIVKTQERNTGGMYLARHLMLQLDKQEEVLVRAEVPETYKVNLSPFKSYFDIAMVSTDAQRFLTVSTVWSFYLQSLPRSPSRAPAPTWPCPSSLPAEVPTAWRSTLDWPTRRPLRCLRPTFPPRLATPLLWPGGLLLLGMYAQIILCMFLDGFWS